MSSGRSFPRHKHHLRRSKLRHARMTFSGSLYVSKKVIWGFGRTELPMSSESQSKGPGYCISPSRTTLALATDSSENRRRRVRDVVLDLDTRSSLRSDCTISGWTPDHFPDILSPTDPPHPLVPARVEMRTSSNPLLPLDVSFRSC